MKFPKEIENTVKWKMAKINAKYAQGQARYFQIGKLVVVIVEDFVIKSNISHEIELISELPESLGRAEFVLTPYSTIYNQIRLGINANDTKIIDWYDNKNASNTMYYGTIIYLTK